MSEKRLKRDPLSWITDSRKAAGESKHSKQSKLSRPETSAQPQDSRPLRAVKSTRQGLKTGWTRATFIVREELLERLKGYAHWERQDLKAVVDQALSSYLKGKTARPKPKED